MYGEIYLLSIFVGKSVTQQLKHVLEKGGRVIGIYIYIGKINLYSL